MPGFSAQNAQKAWAGHEIDYCRAIAAAALADVAKVEIVADHHPGRCTRPARPGAPAERRLLGGIPGFGKKLGVDESWAFNAIRAVGNYGKIYDRNFGSQSPLRFARGVNVLWNAGGAFYPLSFY